VTGVAKGATGAHLHAAVEAPPPAREPIASDVIVSAAASNKAGPRWLQELRDQALAAYKANGLPPPAREGWRGTDLRPLLALALKVAPHADAGPAARGLEGFGFTGEGVRLVFVDGHLAPPLCKVESVPDGVRLGGLSQAWDDPVVEDHFGRHADSDEPAVVLNTLLAQDGAVVEIEAGAHVEKPIHLLFISGGAHAEPLVAAPRSLLLAGPGSKASIVECHASVGTGTTVSNPVTEVSVAPGAHLRHVRIQRQGLRDWHVGTVHARVERDASYQSLAMNVGSAVARTDVTARLVAAGASCDLDGLFLGTASQAQACYTRVEHDMPHTTSRQLYKGILDGASRGAFYGSVRVRPDAQKTDASQVNRNLLLSRKALVDSTPQLEIHADDVKCSHGSTIGHLREDALFFLRSRGLDPERARLLLTLAFAREVLEREEHAGVRGMLDGLLASWFAGRNDMTTPGAPA
jgi:Fe-S cluster assembly protein SufD